MKPTILIGNTESLEFTVTNDMSPQFHGNVIHEVCSTWDLTHQFEIAARMTLEPHLEEHEQGIGSYISVNHERPAAIGKIVRIDATITELDQSTVTCTLSATIGSTVIATGTQIQRVLPIETISKLLNEANDY